MDNKLISDLNRLRIDIDKAVTKDNISYARSASTLLQSIFSNLTKDLEETYMIVAKCNTWFEDFVGEDTGKVVSIRRKEPIRYHTAILLLPKCKTKDVKVSVARAYIDLYHKDFKLDSVITKDKHYRINVGEYKKYSDVTPIKLYQNKVSKDSAIKQILDLI